MKRQNQTICSNGPGKQNCSSLLQIVDRKVAECVAAKYLAKPFDFDELVGKIKQVLKR